MKLENELLYTEIGRIILKNTDITQIDCNKIVQTIQIHFFNLQEIEKLKRWHKYHHGMGSGSAC